MRRRRGLALVLVVVSVVGCEAVLGLRDDYTDSPAATDGGANEDDAVEAVEREASAPTEDAAGNDGGVPAEAGNDGGAPVDASVSDGGDSGTAPMSCNDGDENGDESDVDCGGSTCTKGCADGKKCVTHADCASGNCDGTTCRPWYTIFAPGQPSDSIGLSGVAIGPQGTLCVSGGINGSLAAPTSPEGASETGRSAFVARIDAKGTVLWLRKMTNTSGSGNIFGQAVAADASGDCLFAGVASGPVDIPKAGGGAITLTSTSSTGFIVRMGASDGGALWAIQQAKYVTAAAIAVRPSDGAVIIAGGGDKANGYIRSFAPDGGPELELSIATMNTRIVGMTIDPTNGSVVAAGLYSSAFEVSPLALAQPNPSGVYLLRATLTGATPTPNWLVGYPHGWGYAQALASDGDGGIYAVGGHGGEFTPSCTQAADLANGDGGVAEPLTMKITKTGGCEWASSTFVDGGVNDSMDYNTAVVVDLDGTVVVGGTTQSALLSLGGPVHTTLASLGVRVPYFARYRVADGSYVSSMTTVTVAGSQASAAALARLPRGGIAYAGAYAGSLSFNGVDLPSTGGTGMTGVIVGFSGPP